MRKGKYDSDRDSALHFLCSSDWGNEGFGHVESPTGYVYRISNTWEEVKPLAIDFTSVIEEWLELEGLKDSEEFRKSLVGHFLVIEDSQGFVSVLELKTEGELREAFNAMQKEYDLWEYVKDEDEDFTVEDEEQEG